MLTLFVVDPAQSSHPHYNNPTPPGGRARQLAPAAFLVGTASPCRALRVPAPCRLGRGHLGWKNILVKMSLMWREVLSGVGWRSVWVGEREGLLQWEGGVSWQDGGERAVSAGQGSDHPTWVGDRWTTMDLPLRSTEPLCQLFHQLSVRCCP